MSAEIESGYTTPREHLQVLFLRALAKLRRVHGNARIAAGLHLFCTAALTTWMLVIAVMYSIDPAQRSTVTLATIFVLGGVCLSLIYVGTFAARRPQSIGPASLQDNGSDVTLKDAQDSVANAADATKFIGIASAFHKLPDRLDEQTRTVNYLGNIISSLSIGLLVVDDCGFVVFANSAFRKLAGYKLDGNNADQLVGKPIGTLFTHRSRTQRRLQDARGPGTETTLNAQHKKLVPVILMSTPLPESDPVSGTVCTVIDLTERKRSEEHVRAGRERIESLVRHLHEIQETERSRIARDLHDDLGAVLTALKNGMVRLNDKEDPDAGDAAKELAGLADKANTAVDRVIANLWPQTLDHFGLGAALEVLAAEFEQMHRITTTCKVDIAKGAIDKRQELALYRSSQEALTNIAKHSHARNARISLSNSASQTVLEISDDGHGFAARSPDKQGDGYGLLGMRQRVAAVNGEVLVRTGVQGSTISIKVPLRAGRTEARTLSDSIDEDQTHDQSIAG